jgi:hypothetical protein
MDQTARTGSGNAVPGYGFVACSWAAITGKNAIKNADNYRVFAMAVTLNQIDWTAGDPPGSKP